MPFRQQAQLVIVSVGISLALAGGFYLAVIRQELARTRHRLGSGEDAPIVMAGGSLYIGTSDTLTFNANGTQLNYSSPMQVFQVDVFYYLNDAEQKDTRNVAAGTAGNVELAYCKNGNCSSAQNKDTVTISWDANKNISIQNTANTIQNSSRILPNLRFHSRHKWSLVSVSVNGGTAISCGAGGESECTVLVHTCQGGAGVNCVASY